MADMSKREKLAQILAHYYGYSPNKENTHMRDWRMHLTAVEAILAELREPDDRMRDSGGHEIQRILAQAGATPSEIASDHAEAVIQAMIDAIE